MLMDLDKAKLQTLELVFKSASIDVGVLTINHDTAILFANETFKSWYNVNEGDPLPPKSSLGQTIRLSIQQEEPIRTITDHVLSETFMEMERTFLLYAYKWDLQPDIYTLFLSDISALHHNYENKLKRELRKLTGEMAAGTANYILNPLAVINGSLQLIEKSLQTASAPAVSNISRHVSLAKNQAEQIRDHIHRMLIIGKPIHMELEIVLLSSFLQEVIPDIQKEAMGHRITLVCEYPHSEAQLLVHPAYLKQVLQEIVSNSFDALLDGGQIHIRFDITDHAVTIVITDGGEGIPEDLIPKVTFPFFTTKVDSLGLGLSFCEVVLEKMEGHLHIESASQKTTVLITLPKII